jgi:hypothetical protein
LYYKYFVSATLLLLYPIVCATVATVWIRSGPLCIIARKVRRYMNTALITGITGQDGAYLAELLLNKGYRVVGAFRRASTVNTDRLDALGIADEVELVPFDLTDHGNMRRVTEAVAPDEICNLVA